MANPVEEEIEAVQSIFSEELSVSEGTGGSKLVHYSIKDSLLLTVRLNETYPQTAPVLLLAAHLERVGLQECLQDSIKDQAGSPMLFLLFNTASEWFRGHPFSTSPTPAPVAVAPQVRAGTPKKPCKFFAKGHCRFGSECQNYHPDPKGSSPTKQVVVGRPEGDLAARETTVSSAPPSSTMAKEEPKGGHSQSTREDLKKQSMRTASDVISRIQWDADIKTENFTIGYLDRFVGIIEKPFAAFSWEDLASVGNNVLAVPQHRIQYFKYREEVVWDKKSQLDNVFGSKGGKLIQDVVDAYEKSHGAPSKELEDPSECSGGGGAKGSNKTPPKTRGKEDRPTHFVCIRVSNQEIHSHVQEIQDGVVGHSPHLGEGCLPLAALHVSLCMVQLQSSVQLDVAKSVLHEVRKHILQFLPTSTEITFSGVDNFRDRLIYAKVLPDAGLSRLSSFLLEQFGRAGLRTPGNHAQFTPHMTLVKMSRPMQSACHTGIIDSEAYAQFHDTFIGTQQVDGIYLCSMLEPKQSDGFYKWFHFVPNSLLHLSPLFPAVLSSCLHQNPALGEEERAEVVEMAGKADNSSSSSNSSWRHVAAFDQKIRELMCRCRPSGGNVWFEPAHTTVIILRGLPGSGKSHLLRSCLESDVLACSADDHFSKSDGGYEFQREQLPAAHLGCVEAFLRGVLDGRQVIVLDNTNSMLWEYRMYVSLCQLFGLRCHVLEIPHPSQRVVDAFAGRNLHQVDASAVKSFADRWEVDKRALFVPPKIAYPIISERPKTATSLFSLCQPGYLPRKIANSSSALVGVYSAVFLTPKSQWKLVSSIPPTHPCVHTNHVTLTFEPSEEVAASTEVGRKVSVVVTGLLDSSTVQAVSVNLPKELLVSSGNKHPHVTISTDASSAPKAANALFEAQTSSSLAEPLKLSGVIGLVVKEHAVRESGIVNHHTILSKKHFTDIVLPRLMTEQQPIGDIKPPTNTTKTLPPSPITPPPHSPPSPGLPALEEALEEVAICTGPQLVSELYVFDFDGTLFETPDPDTGRRFYQQCTGHQWPHRGWLSRPESLLPPLRIEPGPSLPDYRQHCGRAGSVTIVLTARVSRTESAVRTVLSDHRLHPDQLILKPDDLHEGSPEFKVGVLAKLLQQFPQVAQVKLWDDREDNLEAMTRFSKRPCNRGINFQITNSTLTTSAVHIGEEPPSTLHSHLASRGLLCTKRHTAAAQTGVRFIATQFCRVTGFQGNPEAVVLVFGSHALGRTSDVDLCLLAPPTLTHAECIEKLASELEMCGISHIHRGYNARCPRLKVLLQFKDTPSIDYDVIFAPVPSIEDSAPSWTSLAPADALCQLEWLVSSGEVDATSQTALSGFILLCKLRGVARKRCVPMHLLGPLVEMTVQVLTAQREKGNFFHCIRTFHIVLLLTHFLDSTQLCPPSSTGTTTTDGDALFEKFVSHTAKLSPQQWQSVFQDYIEVAPQYVPHQTDIFQKLYHVVQQNRTDPAAGCAELMVRPAFPPPGYTPVCIVWSGGDHVERWRLQTVLEARLPTFIRQLLSSGLEVLLDGNGVTDTFCFAVPESSLTQASTQAILSKFWSDFAEYCNSQKRVKLELKFGRNHCDASSKLAKQVEEFANAPSDQSELHFPTSLSPYERLLVYKAAETLHIKHRTPSENGKKHVYLYK